MPINADYKFANAQEKYESALTDEERVVALEEMMRTMPKHKGAEGLRANIRTRYKKLKQEIAKSKKKKGGGKAGIKKAELQAILIGLTNSGKSSLLKTLTNANPEISENSFTTKQPEVGTLIYQGCNIQIIDSPAVDSFSFNKGVLSSADTFLAIIEKISDIPLVLEPIKQTKIPIIVIFNKIDFLDENEKRKISETLKSKRLNHVLISTKTKEGIEELKEKILKSFPIIRVYTKHQGKEAKNQNKPVILSPNSSLEDVAEKILHGFSKRVRYAKITGPSAKFKDQKVGLKHIVQDKDVVEFITE